MDFSLSEEQTLLKDSLERFIQNDYDFDTRRKVMAGEEGFSRENWKQFAELGWLAVPFAEEDGGIGGGAVTGEVQFAHPARLDPARFADREASRVQSVGSSV